MHIWTEGAAPRPLGIPCTPGHRRETLLLTQGPGCGAGHPGGILFPRESCTPRWGHWPASSGVPSPIRAGLEPGSAGWPPLECVLSPLARGELGLPPPTPRPGHPNRHRSARAAWAPKAVLRLASGSREETGTPMAKRQSWCLLWRPLGGKPWPPSQEGDPGKLREDLTELQRPLRTVLEAGEQKHCGTCLGPPPRLGRRRDATDRAGTQLAP